MLPRLPAGNLLFTVYFGHVLFLCMLRGLCIRLQQVQNESPGIFSNAGVWATHMGVSSNVRYQALNGLDMVSCRPSH
jgi:Protein RETICULATA-related